MEAELLADAAPREGDDDGGRCPAIAIDQGRRPLLKVRRSSVRRWFSITVHAGEENPDRSPVMEPSSARSQQSAAPNNSSCF
nr:hypothetical protein Iba_chr13cCG11240 [Ipomoea batatas]